MEKHEKYITYRANRGIYQVKLTVPVQQDGKIIRKPITRQAKTLEEAIQARDDMLTAYNIDRRLLAAAPKKKEDKPEEEKTIEQLIINWYRSYKFARIAPITRDSYRQILCKYIIPVYGHCYPDDISPDTIQLFVSGLQTQGLADGYVKNILAIFRNFFRYLVKYRIAKYNPCVDIVVDEIRPKKSRIALTDAQVTAIYDDARQHDYIMYLLFRLYMETDCRRSELLGLTWRYVDLNKATVTIKKALVKPDTTRIILQNHNKNNVEKTLPLSKRMLGSLGLLYNRQRKYDADFSPDSTVFHHYGERYILPRVATAAFKRVIRRLGYDDSICLHCLRHTATTRLIRSGVPLPVVQKIGGWKTMRSMLDTYTHIPQTDVDTNVRRVLCGEEIEGGSHQKGGKSAPVES